MVSPIDVAKRLVLGRPFRSDRLGETLLPKRIALPIFASDPLSSVAYATQEILLILTLGGLAYLHLAPWVALGRGRAARRRGAVLPAGGAGLPERRRLVRGGRRRTSAAGAGLVVAAALLVDYVMTVAVSVAAGVDNIISAVPELNPYRVAINLGFVVVLMAMNLRGVRESGRTFADPDLRVHRRGAGDDRGRPDQAVVGHAPVAESAGYDDPPRAASA